MRGEAGAWRDLMRPFHSSTGQCTGSGAQTGLQQVGQAACWASSPPLLGRGHFALPFLHSSTAREGSQHTQACAT